MPGLRPGSLLRAINRSVPNTNCKVYSFNTMLQGGLWLLLMANLSMILLLAVMFLTNINHSLSMIYTLYREGDNISCWRLYRRRINRCLQCMGSRQKTVIFTVTSQYGEILSIMMIFYRNWLKILLVRLT